MTTRTPTTSRATSISSCTTIEPRSRRVIKPIPLNDTKRLDQAIDGCDEADLLRLVKRERERWVSIPDQLFEPTSPQKRNRVRSTTTSYLHLMDASARSLQEYDSLYSDHTGDDRNRISTHLPVRVHIGNNIERDTINAWRLIAHHKRLPANDREMQFWKMEDVKRMAMKNRARTALGGYKRHDIRGIKRTATEGLEVLGDPPLSAGMVMSRSLTQTTEQDEKGDGRAQSVPIAVAQGSTNEGGRSTYFTAIVHRPRAVESSTTATPRDPGQTSIADEDLDQTPIALRTAEPPTAPAPASSQFSTHSQRSSASQRKRNSQSNRLGFVAMKPSSQDIAVDVDVKPMVPVGPIPIALVQPVAKAHSWNNTRRTDIVEAKRRRLSDEKEAEERRSSVVAGGMEADGIAGSSKAHTWNNARRKGLVEEKRRRISAEREQAQVGLGNATVRAKDPEPHDPTRTQPMRTEDRPARSTWAVKSPSNSDTEDEDDDEDGSVPMTMAAVKRGQAVGPRLLEDAFRKTKTIAVVDMEVDELGSSLDDVPPNDVEISFNDILTSTPRKTQDGCKRFHSSPASKSFHQMSQEAEPDDTDDDSDGHENAGIRSAGATTSVGRKEQWEGEMEIDRDLDGMLCTIDDEDDTPRAYKRPRFHAPGYDESPLVTPAGRILRTTSCATEMSSPKSSQHMSTQRVGKMADERASEAVQLLMGNVEDQI